MSWVVVSGASGALAASSGDLTVTRTAVGQYAVTLPSSVQGTNYAAFVTPMPTGASSLVGNITSPTPTGFTVSIFASTTGASTDSQFGLLVIYP